DSAVVAAIGPLYVWINNAMQSVFSPFKETTAEEFRRVTEVTYLGYVYGTMAALRRMLPRDRGKIVQVGSALAYRSIPLQSAYCGAKHAVVGFTDSIRCELVHDGSRSEEHTSELQSRDKLVCRLLLEKKNLFGVSFTVNAIFIFCKTTNLLRNLFKMSDVINLVLQ